MKESNKATNKEPKTEPKKESGTISWIQKIAKIVATMGFTVIFLAGLNYDDPFNNNILLLSFIKASLGAILLWFLIFIVCDILFKGVVSDIPKEHLDQLDGGIIQRIYTQKETPEVVNVSEHPHSKEKHEGNRKIKNYK